MKSITIELPEDTPEEVTELIAELMRTPFEEIVELMSPELSAAVNKWNWKIVK